MSVVRTGVDLIETDRLARVRPEIRERFLRRVYTPRELEQCQTDEALIARFAGKEAVSKALGTGIGWVSWQDIEILENSWGAPYVTLHGRARQRAQQLGLEQWSISLSHSRSQAVALVIALGPGSAHDGTDENISG